jgi:hypothetical protein
MARFYGWSPDVINDLDIEDFEQYARAMRMLEAQEVLIGFSTVAFPNMKDNDRSRRWKEIHKQAYPSNYSKNVRRVSTKELAEAMRNR